MIYFLLMFASLSFADSPVSCSRFENTTPFLEVSTRKYPNETFVMAIETDQNCQASANPRLVRYWKAKSGKSSFVGFDCAYPAGTTNRATRENWSKKKGPMSYQVYASFINKATYQTSHPIDSRVELKLQKGPKGQCDVKTFMIIDGKKREVLDVYIEKVSINLFNLSAKVRSARLNVRAGKERKNIWIRR